MSDQDTSIHQLKQRVSTLEHNQRVLEHQINMFLSAAGAPEIQLEKSPYAGMP